MPKRFSEQANEPAPADDDIVVGTKTSTGADVYYTMADLAAKMTTLMAGSLVTAEERTLIASGPAVVALQYRYFRGATAPAVNSNDADPGPTWVVSPGTGTDAVWRIESALNDSVFLAPWSAPTQIRGENGLAGLDGDDGTPGNLYFFQNNAPSEVDRLLNDVWWDEDNDYRQKRWDGSAWVDSFQPMLSLDSAGNVTGLVRASEAGKAFVLIADKFQIWDGAAAQVPFEIIGGVVYIKEAVVRQISAAKIIGGSITGQEIIMAGVGAIMRSDNFVTGVSGWKLDGEGLEVPSLVVRSGMIEANAVTRRYGGNFANTALEADGTWHEVGNLTVAMDAGDTAHVTACFGHTTSAGAPFATDGHIRLRRLDGSEVKTLSYTLPEGNTLPISRQFFDETATTKYIVEIKSVGGTGGARDITLTAIIYRK